MGGLAFHLVESRSEQRGQQLTRWNEPLSAVANSGSSGYVGEMRNQNPIFRPLPSRLRGTLFVHVKLPYFRWIDRRGREIIVS